MQEIELFIAKEDWQAAALALIDFMDHNPNSFDEKVAILAATISMHMEDQRDITYEYISSGLKINPQNYELYLLLGEWYLENNIDLSYLCYENAYYLCQKQMGNNHDDTLYIHSVLENITKNSSINVRPVSFIILSWNTLDMLKACLSSIDDTCYSGAYEIVIVDNGSSDGSKEWLQSLHDIVLIDNPANAGFAAGCNQGIQAASPNHDIFLLNSDTEMMFNSLFTLRMGLYQSDKIGASGAVSNNVHPSQMINEACPSPATGRLYAFRNNIPSLNSIESKDWLVGFAEIIKRPVIDSLHGFDEIYPVGNLEDTDLGFRILESGYLNVCCHNSFIFHWAHASFDSNNINDMELLENNARIFKEKWSMDPFYYSNIRTELIDLITHKPEDSFDILEIGCGTGSTLARIAYLYPNSHVHGLELMEKPAAFGSKKMDIQQGNIETDSLPYSLHSIDYIMFGDVLEHLHDPEQTLRKIKPYLKPNGSVIISLPNIMNAGVIYNLLRGYFTYQDAGILDRTHLKFFTYYEIINMMKRCGYEIDNIFYTSLSTENTESFKEFFDFLCSNEEVAPRNMFDAYQYYFKASLKD